MTKEPSFPSSAKMSGTPALLPEIHGDAIPAREREAVRADHDQPDHDIEGHEPLAQPQPVREDDRLVRELAARLAREEEGLVRLRRHDDETLGRHRDEDEVVREERYEHRIEARHPRAPEELEDLESLDRRVLPCAAERRDPPRGPADEKDDPERRRPADRLLEPPDEPERDHHDPDVPDPEQHAKPAALHRLPEHGELHRDGVLRLVLLPEERLVRLRDRALDDVDDAE